MTASAKDWVSLGYLAVRSEHLDPLQVGFDALELLPIASRVRQVLHGQLVQREVADQGPVFRAHVGDGRSVSHRQQPDAGTEELDEDVSVEVVLPEVFRHQQDDVCGRHHGGNGADQLDSDDLRKSGM